MRISRLLDEATAWASERPDVVGLALVGSHARGTARSDSDVDLILLCTDPNSMLDHRDWPARFGKVRDVEFEDYGALRSLRAFYQDGLEVEFGLAAPAWARVPLDSGTQQVIAGGIRILYDPGGLLGDARNAAVT